MRTKDVNIDNGQKSLLINQENENISTHKFDGSFSSVKNHIQSYFDVENDRVSIEGNEN